MAELGINLVQIISYIIIFFLLYFFTKGFLKKIINNLEVRQKTIAEGINNASQAQILKDRKISEAEEEKKEILNKAFTDAESILNNAKRKAEEIIAKAEREKESLLMYTKKEIEENKEKSKFEGLKEANEIIALAIQKAFEGIELTEEQNKKLIESTLNNIKK